MQIQATRLVNNCFLVCHVMSFTRHSWVVNTASLPLYCTRTYSPHPSVNPVRQRRFCGSSLRRVLYSLFLELVMMSLILAEPLFRHVSSYSTPMLWPCRIRFYISLIPGLMTLLFSQTSILTTLSIRINRYLLHIVLLARNWMPVLSRCPARVTLHPVRSSYP